MDSYRTVGLCSKNVRRDDLCGVPSERGVVLSGGIPRVCTLGWYAMPRQGMEFETRVVIHVERRHSRRTVSNPIQKIVRRNVRRRDRGQRPQLQKIRIRRHGFESDRRPLLKTRSKRRPMRRSFRTRGCFIGGNSQGVHPGLVCDAPSGHGIRNTGRHSRRTSTLR